MILDAYCGPLKMYRGMIEGLINSSDFIPIDKRQGDFSYDGERGRCNVVVKPKVLADMRFLPFIDGSMDAIFFDPPHAKFGTTSRYIKYYGSWSQEETIFHLRFVDLEFARVLHEGGFLFLKIMGDREEIYRGMLKHFSFICPIQLNRTRGSYKNPNGNIDGAIWWICQKAKTPSQVKATAQLRFEPECVIG